MILRDRAFISSILKLLIEEEPGQVTRGTGEINILKGRYRAYGQFLDIENGRLLFTGVPLTNPGLDIPAIRKSNGITTGIKVGGRLQQPQLELFSIPAMGQTDTLSYLLLGRPMENATGAEGAMMAKAALALGLAGGDQLARTIGDRFGLDEMRVESSESRDQASLVVGRYLSPRLYVSYGVGLIESFNTLNLRYQISDKWQLKTESGKPRVPICYTPLNAELTVLHAALLCLQQSFKQLKRAIETHLGRTQSQTQVSRYFL